MMPISCTAAPMSANDTLCLCSTQKCLPPLTCVTNHALDHDVHQEPVIVRAVDLLQHVLPHQRRREVHDEEENVHGSCLRLLDPGLQSHLQPGQHAVLLSKIHQT